jgi:hypothetical protein
MNTPKITAPVQYKHCIITAVGGNPSNGYDVFESSGRWFHVSTQKRAKWWASIHTRLQTEFGSNAPRQVPVV